MGAPGASRARPDLLARAALAAVLALLPACSGGTSSPPAPTGNSAVPTGRPDDRSAPGAVERLLTWTTAPGRAATAAELASVPVRVVGPAVGQRGPELAIHAVNGTSLAFGDPVFVFEGADQRRVELDDYIPAGGSLYTHVPLPPGPTPTVGSLVAARVLEPTPAAPPTPRRTTGPFTSLACGSSHTCGLRPDGRLQCWGEGSPLPLAVPPEGAFAAGGAGNTHSCALDGAGLPTCWGWDAAGQLGAPSTPMTFVDGGYMHGCGLGSDGAALCWGYDGHGQLGVPQAALTALSVGWEHNCGLTGDGAAVCWGRSSEGQLDAPKKPWRSIGAGSAHSCGLDPSGAIACWGLDVRGQASPPTGTWASRAVGTEHHCALDPPGQAASWGRSAEGQTAAPAEPFVALCAGDVHSCGLTSTGEAVCWGCAGTGGAECGAEP